MRTYGFMSALLRLPPCLLLLSLLLSTSISAEETRLPKVSRTKFEYQPSDLLYFARSETILVTDDHAWGTGTVTISKDGGKTWDSIPELADAQIIKVYMNPHNNQIAIAAGAERKHWITKDQGRTWRSFETKLHPNFAVPPFSFHSLDKDRIIMNMRDIDGPEAGERTLYTIDGFDTHPAVLREQTVRCLWAKEQAQMSTGSTTKDNDRALCIVEGKYSARPDEWRLVISDDFFATEFEAGVDEGRPVTGIASMVAVKSYILAARNSEGTDEMALYVTKDTQEWYRAQFGQHKLKEGGYTIMESTNYSLQVDVMTPESTAGAAMGMLYTSNSAGQYFSRNEEYTNRNQYGFVDFEKVAAIQGIVLTNIVSNAQAVRETGVGKKVVSKISFDDGRTFHDFMAGSEKLHLHSITDQRNAGRVFSSPAPGLLMGIGNTGDVLRDYNDGDLYVSQDAGATWRKALDGAHKYEFGDQGGIFLAVYDEADMGKMIYSLNYGKDWSEFFFEKDFNLPGVVKPQLLITSPDSSSLKFVLVGTTGKSPEVQRWIYSIDFAGLGLRKCGTDDFETWTARRNADGEPSCVLGHTQSFRRRKPDVACFVEEEFKEIAPKNDHVGCFCKESDFECDFGYVRNEDRTRCLPMPGTAIKPPEGACENSESEFEGPSGFRLIPGDDCILDGGLDKTKTVKRPCSETVHVPVSGEISREITTFPADIFTEYYYLERAVNTTGTDETVVLLTDDRQVYVTHNHGKAWEHILADSEIVAIYPNRHINDNVYFITPGRTVHYSKDRGNTLHSFEAPGRPNTARLQILKFHPKEADWLIWTTCADSDSPGAICQPWAQASTKNGDVWTPLMRSIENCEFVYREGRRDATDEKLIYCTHFVNEDTNGPKELVGSTDFFETKTAYFKDMLNFATMSEYIVVAAKEGDNSEYLKVETSIDGKVFADAKFPQNLLVPHQTAYTVLDSSTHSIFLHVTVNSVRDEEYGSIIKSNSNGTSYVLSLEGVNRNAYGYVDFEKLIHLEGVAIANVVSNIGDVAEGSAKKLKTVITHNDGAQWALISPPETDASGQKYECIGGPLEDCALHLHGYTEREDARDTYASASAVGLMIGIGNVGPVLRSKREGNTFISSDGGVTWSTAKNGHYMWEYGDQGSIIVIVERANPTTVVFYSRDEGKRWTEYKFSDTPMQILDITTLPSDTSRNFMLWGRESGGMGRAVTVNLDFSGLTDRRCNLGEPDAADNDYYLWSPKHPTQSNDCVFGHVAQYWRKKLDANCYNGPLIENFYQIKESCACTERDFECDYNYERQSDNTCQLVKGLKAQDPAEQCDRDPKLKEYHVTTGYRKLPQSTCEGGKELDGETLPCHGYEPDYRKKHGISAVGLFFAIVIPILAAVGIGYWVYRRSQGQLGRIRLGADAPNGVSTGSSSSGQSLWIKYPVTAVAGLAALVMATPRAIGGVIRFIRERAGRRGGGAGGSRFGGLNGGGGAQGPYRTRGSFRRGRNEYSAVGTGDEGELLGDDSDDDV